MTQLALNIQQLFKRYGSSDAVHNLSFSIKPGEVFGLLGPNGAGKTTTISCITTLEKPSSGHIEIFGIDNQKKPDQAKKLFGCVPQELIHHGYFTTEKILEFHALYHGILNAKKSIDELLHKLHLHPHRNKLVSQLSGGMKRRLLIAKALVHRPKLLLLDEPTAGVDVELRHNMWDLILKLREEGSSILLTTHYLEEAEKLCDRIGVLQTGKLLTCSFTQDLLETNGGRTITLTLQKSPSQFNHPFLVKNTQEQLVFQVPQKYPFSQLLKEIPIDVNTIQDISTKECRLEDIFTKLLQKDPFQ